MLSLHPDIVYVHEPFSPLNGRCVCGAHFEDWFTYITHENESLYYEHISKTLSFDCQYKRKLRSLLNGENAYLKLRETAYLLKHRFFTHRSRPLMKDPIALFSLEWLANSFGADVLILIRHPAAFVHSIVQAGWKIPFDNLLRQHSLMNGQLKRFASDIERFAEIEQGLIDQAILFWKIAHHQIATYRDKHQDQWIFIRHEDITPNPVEQFRCLYERLSIPFDGRFADIIDAHSKDASHDEGVTKDESGSYITRDTTAIVRQWSRQLSERDIHYIKEQTDPLWRKYYTEADW